VEELDELGGGGAGGEAELLHEDRLPPQRHREEDPKVGQRRRPDQLLLEAQNHRGVEHSKRRDDADEASREGQCGCGDGDGLHDHILQRTERPSARRQHLEDAVADERTLNRAHCHPAGLKTKVHVGEAPAGAEARSGGVGAMIHGLRDPRGRARARA
jgi:hypothetical protein